MTSKTNKPEIQKVTERIEKLFNTTQGLSEKDIIAITYIIDKTVRVSSVALMLADVLDNNAKLQTEIQRSSIRLVRDATMAVRSAQHREALIQGLMDIVVLLEVGQTTGSLSKMNTDTLSDDIILFVDFLNTIDWHHGRRFADEAYFGGSAPRDVFSPEPFSQRQESFVRHQRDTQSATSTTQQQRSDVYTTSTQKDSEQKQRPQYKERIQEIQKDRRATILGLVQKKDRITVKDVANVIKDCSEKTIQRELLALVKQGVLKKEGERRWSTYSLA
jgi:hypothetical protein